MSLEAPGRTWISLVLVPSFLILRISAPPSTTLTRDRYSDLTAVSNVFLHPEDPTPTLLLPPIPPGPPGQPTKGDPTHRPSNHCAPGGTSCPPTLAQHQAPASRAGRLARKWRFVQR